MSRDGEGGGFGIAVTKQQLHSPNYGRAVPVLRVSQSECKMSSSLLISLFMPMRATLELVYVPTEAKCNQPGKLPSWRSLNSIADNRGGGSLRHTGWLQPTKGSSNRRPQRWSLYYEPSGRRSIGFTCQYTSMTPAEMPRRFIDFTCRSQPSMWNNADRAVLMRPRKQCTNDRSYGTWTAL